jgi:hypothetical protein
MNLDDTNDVQPSSAPEDDAKLITPEAMATELELTDDELATLSGGFMIKGGPPPPTAPPGRMQPF